VCISLLLFLRKASPMPSTVGLPKLLENFGYDAGASMSKNLLESFSSEKRHPRLPTHGCRSINSMRGL
jgi:hypothetical protein